LLALPLLRILDANLEWIQSILSAEAGQFPDGTKQRHSSKRTNPAHGRVRSDYSTVLPVVMVVMMTVMTGLGRQYHARKHC